MTFGEVLRHLRKKKRWTQNETARRAGLHINTYPLIERDEVNTKLDTVFKLASAFEVRPEIIIAAMDREIPKEGRQRA